MFGTNKGTLDSTDSRLNGKKLTIGIVQARFNEPITNALAQACTAQSVGSWTRVPSSIAIARSGA